MPNVTANQTGRTATVDFCNPDKSPYLVIKELRALELLDNAIVRVRVLLRSEYRLL